MCGEPSKQMQSDFVSDDETYTRWVYMPRYGEAADSLNNRFISLREDEEGISGQILERAGHKTVLTWGMRFRRKSKDGTHKEERFIGYARALVGQIRAVADEEGDKVDVLLTESQVPFHAEIRFELGGCHVVGNNQHPKFLRYKDKLKSLLGDELYQATSEELEEVQAVVE